MCIRDSSYLPDTPRALGGGAYVSEPGTEGARRIREIRVSKVHELSDASLGYSEVRWVPEENQAVRARLIASGAADTFAAEGTVAADVCEAKEAYASRDGGPYAVRDFLPSIGAGLAGGWIGSMFMVRSMSRNPWRPLSDTGRCRRETAYYSAGMPGIAPLSHSGRKRRGISTRKPSCSWTS